MKRVLVTCPPMLGRIGDVMDHAAEAGLELVTANVVQTLSEAELIETLPDFDGWIIGDDPATAAVFEAGVAGKLRAAVKWGVGTDNVDFKAAQRLGIPITNTPRAFGGEVADIAMHYVTALARETFLIDRGVRNGRWPKPCGISLGEKRVGLIGFGDIGRQTARRLLAADMKVTAYDPYAEAVADIPVERAEWPEGLEQHDFLVFTCPLTPSTTGMFNENIVSSLKPGVRVVNVARGPVIKEAALIDALRAGIVHSAALDVFEVEPLPSDSPLREFERCLFGSHNASNTSDAVRRVSVLAIDHMAGFLRPNA